MFINIVRHIFPFLCTFMQKPRQNVKMTGVTAQVDLFKYFNIIAAYCVIKGYTVKCIHLHLYCYALLARISHVFLTFWPPAPVFLCIVS